MLINVSIPNLIKYHMFDWLFRKTQTDDAYKVIIPNFLIENKF